VQLSATTQSSGRLATDSARLNRSAASERIDGIRSAASGLRSDAAKFQDEVGRSVAQIRPLMRRAVNAHVREYLRDVLLGLTVQWAEAEALIRAAETIWWDPWLTSGNDARRFAGLDATARWEAWRAVRSTSAAAEIRHRYPQAFRFVPVNDRPGSQQAAAASDGRQR
jgi:hypothetical protein